MLTTLVDFPPSLQSRFHPLSLLGQGGFGAVWRCRDRSLEREVAVKLLVLGQTPEVVARFEREARLTAQLRSPHVVEVYDHGVADAVPWIAYALLDGYNLDEWLAREGRPDARLLARWAVQGSEALAVVHQAGLVHRDVKPANFLARAEDRSLVLVDFGIARAEQRAAETLHTEEGVILGTPGYMAPELLMAYPPSARSDQWAWAAVLVELATGQIPYGTHEPRAVVAAAAGFDPASLALAGEIGAVLQRALSPDPKRRYAGMRELAEALEATSFEALLAGPAPAATQQSPGPLPIREIGETVARAPAEDPAPPLELRSWRAPWVVAGLGLALGFAALATLPPAPAPTPAAAATAPARPTKAELQQGRDAFKVAEREFREAFTSKTQPEPWNWVSRWGGDYRQNRVRAREAFQAAAAGPLWENLASATVRLVELTERLPAAARRRWAPEIYASARFGEAIQNILGRGTGLAVDMSSDWVEGVLARGETAKTANELKLTRARFLDMLEALDRLARDLEELPLRSPELRFLSRWLAFGSRRGDVPDRLMKLLRMGSPPDPDFEWLVLRTSARALFRDQPFKYWGNLHGLQTPGVCRILEPALANLRPRSRALAGVRRRAEMSAYLWRLEVLGRGICSPPLRRPVEVMQADLRRALEDLLEAHLDDWPPGHFLDDSARGLELLQPLLEERGDPAAALHAEALAELRLLVKARASS